MSAPGPRERLSTAERRRQLARLRQLVVDGRPLRTAEVMQLLNVSGETVYNWVRAGRVKSTQTPGGHHLYEASQFVALVADGTPLSTGEVMRLLGINQRAVRWLREKGVITSNMTPGGHHRHPPAQFAAMLPRNEA